MTIGIRASDLPPIRLSPRDEELRSICSRLPQPVQEQMLEALHTGFDELRVALAQTRDDWISDLKKELSQLRADADRRFDDAMKRWRVHDATPEAMLQSSSSEHLDLQQHHIDPIPSQLCSKLIQTGGPLLSSSQSVMAALQPNQIESVQPNQFASVHLQSIRTLESDPSAEHFDLVSTKAAQVTSQLCIKPIAQELPSSQSLRDQLQVKLAELDARIEARVRLKEAQAREVSSGCMDDLQTQPTELAIVNPSEHIDLEQNQIETVNFQLCSKPISQEVPSRLIQTGTHHFDLAKSCPQSIQFHSKALTMAETFLLDLPKRPTDEDLVTNQITQAVHRNGGCVSGQFEYNDAEEDPPPPFKENWKEVDASRGVGSEEGPDNEKDKQAVIVRLLDHLVPNLSESGKFLESLRGNSNVQKTCSGEGIQREYARPTLGPTSSQIVKGAVPVLAAVSTNGYHVKHKPPDWKLLTRLVQKGILNCNVDNLSKKQKVKLKGKFAFKKSEIELKFRVDVSEKQESQKAVATEMMWYSPVPKLNETLWMFLAEIDQALNLHAHLRQNLLTNSEKNIRDLIGDAECNELVDESINVYMHRTVITSLMDAMRSKGHNWNTPAYAFINNCHIGSFIGPMVFQSQKCATMKIKQMSTKSDDPDVFVPGGYAQTTLVLTTCFQLGNGVVPVTTSDVSREGIGAHLVTKITLYLEGGSTIIFDMSLHQNGNDPGLSELEMTTDSMFPPPCTLSVLAATDLQNVVGHEMMMEEPYELVLRKIWQNNSVNNVLKEFKGLNQKGCKGAYTDHLAMAKSTLLMEVLCKLLVQIHFNVTFKFELRDWQVSIEMVDLPAQTLALLMEIVIAAREMELPRCSSIIGMIFDWKGKKINVFKVDLKHTQASKQKWNSYMRLHHMYQFELEKSNSDRKRVLFSEELYLTKKEHYTERKWRKILQGNQVQVVTVLIEDNLTRLHIMVNDVMCRKCNQLKEKVPSDRLEDKSNLMDGGMLDIRG